MGVQDAKARREERDAARQAYADEKRRGVASDNVTDTRTSGFETGAATAAVPGNRNITGGDRDIVGRDRDVIGRDRDVTDRDREATDNIGYNHGFAPVPTPMINPEERLQSRGNVPVGGGEYSTEEGPRATDASEAKYMSGLGNDRAFMTALGQDQSFVGEGQTTPERFGQVEGVKTIGATEQGVTEGEYAPTLRRDGGIVGNEEIAGGASRDFTKDREGEVRGGDAYYQQGGIAEGDRVRGHRGDGTRDDEFDEHGVPRKDKGITGWLKETFVEKPKEAAQVR